MKENHYSINDKVSNNRFDLTHNLENIVYNELLYRDYDLSVYKDNPVSVHLNDYPTYDEKLIDKKLEDDMQITIDVCSLGSSARNEAKIKNRQPLKEMLVKVGSKIHDYYTEIIKQELNIKEVIFKDDLSEYINYIFKPQLKTLGPKYGKDLNKIRELLSKLDGNKSYSDLKTNGFISLSVDGKDIKLEEEDLLIEATKKEGFVTAILNDKTIVLDTSLDESLINEGYIREIISKIQTMRKETNFDVMDKINVYIYGNDKISTIVNNNKDMLFKDIMASNIELVEPNSKDAIIKEWDINDEKCFIAINK